MTYSIGPIAKDLAKELIIKNHYSHKWTSCRYALGLFNDGVLVGVAVYGYPVGRQAAQSVNPMIGAKQVLELTRLWVADSEGKNTESRFLSMTFAWLRANAPDIKALLSYSDPMYGHRGIIYQATNWIYQGDKTMLVKGFIHVVNGEHLHPRTCVAKYGSAKPEVLLAVDPGYYRIEMPRKHRYVYPLYKNVRRMIEADMKRPPLPYPKS